MKFRVKAGTHVEEGRTYTKGKVVNTQRELDKLFPLKFDRMGKVVDDEGEGDDALPSPDQDAPAPSKAPVAPKPAPSKPSKTAKVRGDDFS